MQPYFYIILEYKNLYFTKSKLYRHNTLLIQQASVIMSIVYQKTSKHVVSLI